MSVSDPSNQLATFEDVIDAFKKFPEGGFWVKKIIQRMGIFRETVMGPYKKKEADEIADRWGKIFKFEDQKVAHVFQFKELICSPSPRELGDRAWKPPVGSGLLCLLYGYYPLSVYSVEEIGNDREFRKFYNYTRPEGIRSKRVGDKMIFFNRENVDSYRRSSAMTQFLDKDTTGYEDEQMSWMIGKISGKNVDHLEKPKMIPGYIARLDWECSQIEMDWFKDFYISGKGGLGRAYNKLRKCAPEDDKTFFFHEDVKFESVETELLIDNKINVYDRDQPVTREMIDRTMKRLVIEKGSNGKYNVMITNYEGNFSVGIYAISQNGKEGRMIIHLPNSDYDPLSEKESIFISKNLRKNRYFSKMDVIGAILLFIVKCLGVKKIWIEDDRVDDCDCGANPIASFINPVRFLAGEPSIYANLGFQNAEQEKLDQIIEQYKDTELPVDDPSLDFPGEIEDGYETDDSSSSLETDEEEGDEEEWEQETMKLSDLAVMYLSRDCTYENLCEVMRVVTDDIYEKIPNRYELDLEGMKLEYLRELF